MEQILTPSGYIGVDEINIGDEVLAYDILTGEEIINVVEKKTYYDHDPNPEDEDFTFYLINGTWKLYKNQSVWANDNVTHACLLKVGDIVYDGNNNEVAITSITQTTEDYFIRFEISGDHSYIIDGLSLHNASRYWVGGGSSTNWNATANTNWSATDGGAFNASVPSSSDDANFTSNSNSANIISATITVLSWIAVTGAGGYTNTTTRNAVITVVNNVTLSANATYAGASGMIINSTSSMTSNAVVWTNALTLSGAATKTLVGNWSVGLLTIGTSVIIIKTTAETISCSGGLTVTGNMGGANGTTVARIIITGGTWSGNFNTQINIDLAGDVTITSTSWGIATGSVELRYISGTISHSGTLTFIGSAVTLNVPGVTIANMTSNSTAKVITFDNTFSLSGTFTIAGDVSFAGISTFDTMGALTINTSCTVTLINSWFVIGTITLTGAVSAIIINGAYTIQGQGNLTLAGITTGNVQGTASFKLVGTGTITGSNSTGNLRNNLEIGSAGNYTFTAVTFTYITGTFLISSGAVVDMNQSGFIFQVTGSCTLTNNNAVTTIRTFNWRPTTAVINPTFNGSFGFNFGSLLLNNISTGVQTNTMTLKVGNVYTINTAITYAEAASGADSAFRFVIKSDTGGSKATLILANGATQDIARTNATDIDSSLGQTIWAYKGVLSNTTNWNLLTAPKTVAFTF